MNAANIQTPSRLKSDARISLTQISLPTAVFSPRFLCIPWFD
jgi:hypothetical protein